MKSAGHISHLPPDKWWLCYSALLAAILILTNSCKPPNTNRSSLNYIPKEEKYYRPPTSGTPIYYVPMYRGGKYWGDIHAGLDLALRKSRNRFPDIKLVIRSPETQSFPELQVKLIDDIIEYKTSGTAKVSGIILAPQNEDVLIAPVERAKKAGIPVVLIDTDLTDNSSVECIISSDNYKAGEMAADFLGKKHKEACNVLIFTPHDKRANTNKRVKGFKDAIKKFPNITIVKEAFAGDGREKASRNAINLLNTYGNRIQAIYTTDIDTTEGMIVALNFKKKERTYTFIGFDAAVMTRDAIRNKTLTGLILQDPVEIGENALSVMIDIINGKQVNKRITTKCYLAHQDNIRSKQMINILKTRKAIELYNRTSPPTKKIKKKP